MTHHMSNYCADLPGMTNPVPDGLSIEYKRYYGCARGELKLSDLVNHPPLASEFRRLGLSLSEESSNLVLSDTGSLGNDGSNTVLIAADPVKHLA